MEAIVHGVAIRAQGLLVHCRHYSIGDDQHHNHRVGDFLKVICGDKDFASKTGKPHAETFDLCVVDGKVNCKSVVPGLWSLVFEVLRNTLCCLLNMLNMYIYNHQ